MKVGVLSDSEEDKHLDYFIKGDIFREIVKDMLEKAGYAVYPYGYESTFPGVKSKLRHPGDSKTTWRIKSSPDLLVYDDQTNDLMLVEVKMRSHAPPHIAPREIRNLKEFWNDCILVVVIPIDNVFYAQRVDHPLETKEVYNQAEDFKKFQDIFTRVLIQDLYHYQDFARKYMQALKPHRPRRY